MIQLLLIGALISIIHTVRPWPITSPPSHPRGATSLLPNSTLTNGTHAFRRTVILISLDGAKPTYLQPSLAPHLVSLGLSSQRSRLASYLQPIFPTLTFPNHWSLLTGLYASAHGIVANDFTDTSTHKQFYYTNPSQSWNASWWRGEPIWATAQRSGLNSAVLMWPGPPVTAAGVEPRYFQEYQGGPHWNLDARMNQILKWIDVQDVSERASLICAYVPDIDQAAHKFGPESKQALEAVRRVDGFIGKLQQQLVKERGLGEIVDILVVSDHGMTSTSNERLIFLDDLLGSELYAKLEARDGWPSAGLRFKGDTDEQRQALEQKALDHLSSLVHKHRRGWKLFTRQELPQRFHLADHGRVHDRLAPVWLIPDLGWSITSHDEMATFADRTYAPRGNHGYDNSEQDMHAIFVAQGPSFKALERKQAARRKCNMDGFANIEVHNLVSRILGVRHESRAPTNGTWSFWDVHLREIGRAHV